MELAFVVAGLPPAKDEAKSLLASDHPGRDRVIRLLDAARDAAAAVGWRCTKEPIGIDVVLRVPGYHRVADATNLLGGIADVLEAKDRRERVTPGVTGHLGELAGVGLYDDDAQIHSILYRRDESSSIGYMVRLHVL